jgi:hypothetical protein
VVAEIEEETMDRPADEEDVRTMMTWALEDHMAQIVGSLSPRPGLTFRYVVGHDDTVATGPPTKPLIGFMDDTGVTLAAGSTYTVGITASGLFTASAI